MMKTVLNHTYCPAVYAAVKHVEHVSRAWLLEEKGIESVLVKHIVAVNDEVDRLLVEISVRLKWMEDDRLYQLLVGVPIKVKRVVDERKMLEEFEESLASCQLVKFHIDDGHITEIRKE